VVCPVTDMEHRIREADSSLDKSIISSLGLGSWGFEFFWA
jgi:hypothetical protein